HGALGERYRRQGDLARAVIELELSVAHPPEPVNALLSLAATRLARGETRAAEQLLARVPDAARGSAAFHFLRAPVLYAREKLHEALAEFKSAQRLDPSPAIASGVERLERELSAPSDRSLESRRFQAVFQGSR